MKKLKIIAGIILVIGVVCMLFTKPWQEEKNVLKENETSKETEKEVPKKKVPKKETSVATSQQEEKKAITLTDYEEVFSTFFTDTQLHDMAVAVKEYIEMYHKRATSGRLLDYQHITEDRHLICYWYLDNGIVIEMTYGFETQAYTFADTYYSREDIRTKKVKQSKEITDQETEQAIKELYPEGEQVGE